VLAGKSLFIKCLRNYYGISSPDDPHIGSGNGRSVTSSACFYSAGDLGLVADMGGWNDSDRRFTGQDMADLTTIELSAKGVERVHFLVFESLASDTMQLRNSIAELVQGFGESARQSIVVVASKLDRADCDEVQQRLDYIRETMHDLNIGNRLVRWQSKGFNDSKFEDQLGYLIDSLNATPTVATLQLEFLTSRIQERAKELHANQVLERTATTMDVEENYVKKVFVRKDVEEVYWTKQYTDMSLMKYEMETTPFPAVMSYIGTLGIRAITSAMSTIPKVDWVQKTRTVKKWEETFVNDTRMVTRTVEVTFPPKPLENFISQARDEITSEMKAKLMKNSLPIATATNASA